MLMGMRLVLRQLVLLCLALSLLPGWAELLENLEHLAHDGHLAHSVALDDHSVEDEARHQAIEAEHGCTPVSHNCVCHTSVPILIPDAFQLEPAVASVRIVRPAIDEDRWTTRATAPPVPPARA